MLDVTIFKTIHSGEIEARKLSTYLKSFDAFSVEVAGSTQKSAEFYERDWNKLINSNVSRSKFLQNVGEIVRQGNPYHLSQEYVTKLYDYMYRQKLPLYYFERWEDNRETRKLHKLTIEGESQFDNGIGLIQLGKDSQGIELCYEGVKKQHESIKARDQNGAQNLEKAEQVLRTAYPTLKKDPLKLGIQIGQAHRPEKYSTISVTVVDLVGERTAEMTALDRIDDMLWEEADLNKLIPLFREVASRRIYRTDI